MMGHPSGCWVSFEAQRRGRVLAVALGFFLGLAAGVAAFLAGAACPPFS